jgi:4-amino-4-deoxy-L-arabinose transferase-like glycosyltransferase
VPATGTGVAGRGRATTLLAAALVLGVALRLGFALGYWVGKPLTHDEVEYLQLAQSLADGHGFTYGTAGAAGTSPQFGRAPLYPLFLAGIVRVAGPALRDQSPATTLSRSIAVVPQPGTLAAVKIAQALLGGLSILLIAAVARRAAGDAAGVAAAWVAALYPPLVWIGCYVLSEALFIPLAFGAVLVLGRAIDGDPGAAGRDAMPRRGPVLAAGVLAGLATLARPMMLFFLLAAGAWLLWRRRALWLVLLALGTALVVIPWTMRNYARTGHVVLVASEGGVTFWTGNNPLARGEGDLAANPDMKRAEIALRQRYPGWTAEQLEQVYYREAFAFIRQQPAAWLSLLGRKAFYTWVPVGPSYRLHSGRYFWASVVSYLAVLPLAVLGFFALRRRGTRPRALWLFAASSLLACLVFFPQERFRIPVLDPALVVCAAAWLGGKPAVARLVSTR